MKKITTLLFLSYLVFSGADRINFSGSNLSFFKIIPHIPIGLLLLLSIFLFRFKIINFSWIFNKKYFLFHFVSFFILILISSLFSIDILYSFKRLALLFFIIITITCTISSFNNKEISYYVYKASIFGSLIFYLFNILLFMNWIGYLNLDSNIINLNPDYIAYFIPRLGGFSADVNRGIVILVIYTFFLFSYKNKKSYIYIIIALNILFVFASFSRNGILLLLTTLFLYSIFYSTKKEKKSIFILLPVSLFILFNVANFYSNNNIIDIQSALEERLNLDDFSHDTSTGIHFKLINEGFRIAFSDVKIFVIGCGYGVSNKIIKGFAMSHNKAANFHSQYLSVLVENGIFTFITFISIAIILPVMKYRNRLLPLIVGLFFFNIFYELTNEPMYWFTLLYYYKFNDLT